MARRAADRLERADDFFAECADVHRTLNKIEHLFAEENIAYAVIGGMAMNIHGFKRVTNDGVPPLGGAETAPIRRPRTTARLRRRSPQNA